MSLGKGKPSTDHQFEGCRSPGEPIVLRHWVSISSFSKDLVDLQLDCFRLKDEDVLLLSRVIMFHFRFHAMRVVRRAKGVCLYINCNLIHVCFILWIGRVGSSKAHTNLAHLQLLT